MEPAIIDWKNIESEYVVDELYEHIDAPKWLDLSAPSPPPVDADAYFCRPQCCHPKTPEALVTNHKVKATTASSTAMPLGERNGNKQSLKRRGGIASLLHSSSLREPVGSKGGTKKFRDDLENQNPNIAPAAVPSRPIKVAKESAKPSAEEEEKTESANKKQMPRLASKLSARNLFSGSDILSQLSEFCHEIKKLAVGREKPKVEEDKVLLESSPKKSDGSAKRIGRLALQVRTDGGNASALKEVRGCPPTPQRFPSPSSRRLRSTKTAACASSTLHRTPLKSSALDLDGGGEEKRALVAKDDICIRSSVVSDTDGNSFDVFWFFKPCAYLVK